MCYWNITRVKAGRESNRSCDSLHEAREEPLPNHGLADPAGRISM